MDRVSLPARPKLNLRLLVGPVSADGYHPLQSLMVALDGLADQVTVQRADVRVLECPGVEGPDHRNLAWAALDALADEVGESLPALAITIDKVLPTQAGMGGGSSDAAATLLAADQLLGLGLGHDRLERAAAAVGSDVPFFIRGGAQWATGRGEVLEPARCPGFEAVIVAPERGLSTRTVYAAFDALPAPPSDSGGPPPADAAGLAAWCRNDLWPAARRLAPDLAVIHDALVSAGAATPLLCGSGSAMCGITITADAADAMAERLRHAVPGARVMRVRFPGA
ncbi:MAG: 4-(cytidine 5'-diphospho)-2-C-methyl-D-erythritol kinase [Thermoleophilia bacterium]|nr:4-(cytidine 5'-diphospho)-2-C-methyl-D-erythritol kinase [Thermoleophilia bacterium]